MRGADRERLDPSERLERSGLVILGVDASNIRAGGGLSYLAGMLNAADPPKHGIDQVIVWGPRSTLDRMPDAPWLDARHVPALDGNLIKRAWWQSRRFPELAKSCDIVFAPGSNAPFDIHPLVTLSQNMLPFDWREMWRFGLSLVTLRFLVLRWSQKRTFERADGMIFLSQYAHDAIRSRVDIGARTAIIPHGISPKFRAEPRPARAIADCSEERPLRLLYVSIINVYKHQWVVAEAVQRLRSAGMPIVIDFVGPAYGPALRRFRKVLSRLDPEGRFLRYRGEIPYDELHATYQEADIFVFASSCENLPNIMIEAMSAGLPIASSHSPPMPEVLGDSGVYFDPEDPEDIAQVLRRLAEDPAERDRLAGASYEKSQVYSWDACAERTMQFIADISRVTDAPLHRG